jgi:Opioid growth factor receptor (OGFr) conserved region
MPAESDLIKFYRGSGTDHAGRRLEEILRWDDAALESVHDYIQWVFPNTDTSRANPFAPLLTPADCETFRTDPVLHATLRRAFDRILTFYGLERVSSDQSVEISPSDNWNSRSPGWLTPSNHNHLRLTRIMKCLKALGLEQDALALQHALLSLGERRGGRAVSPVTLRYWRAALQ